ncbi:uncharacterized protein N7483_011351 [Penicillium malachiteum]|uniref:uncharacterized protein n=1 Tax=Penicillium malachiteum TaxID=1324776 RepID=UPI0025476E93|nr:uncharacterized protein N7483_011351 [Penicillium malachiteum]KAJ5714170.1 hypothetical protein N7483_011351 [Penicillium malachiteum]
MREPLNYILLGLSLSSLSLAGVVKRDTVRFRDLSVTAGSLHNIHVEFDDDFEGPLHIVYGDCGKDHPIYSHHEIGSVYVKRHEQPGRFVWITPSDAPPANCIHAFSGEVLLGRSSPIQVSKPLKRRESIADVADMEGPWFDGVAYMKSKKNSDAFIAKAKDTSVAILGGGMSGLMTSHLLESVGIHNWHIFESSERIGGRIRTKYLNNSRPDQYQYQEMGPMRFPVSITYSDTNETLQIMDHRMVFQLGHVLNKMNAGNPELQVNFIPWYENGPNLPADSGGDRLPDGRIPTNAEVSANSSLVYTAPSSNATAVSDAEAAFDNYTKLDKISTIRSIARNMYKAHKQALEDGMFHWSEWGYLKYALGVNSNISDYVAGTTDTPIWGDFYDDVYFAATEWHTIDQGLESLPRAFFPHVESRLTLNRTIEGLQWNETSGKIAIAWREDPLQMKPETLDFDYAVVAVPFGRVRIWGLPRYSSLLSRAISTLNYDPACKMALMYRTRFWEHLDAPIYGGCGAVDVSGVGDVCYPSYNINGTGPGVILASYISGTEARSVVSLSDEAHVALVQRAIVEFHGDIAAEQFTGIYDRQCWAVDPDQAGAWADPLVGQQELYLPAYYQTEFKTIFIGEHTSYTHAWIFSALDSAVRGTTQLLLDLGLVDEAKSVVDTWMGRWISL